MATRHQLEIGRRLRASINPVDLSLPLLARHRVNYFRLKPYPSIATDRDHQ